jgi:hypothetical protein
MRLAADSSASWEARADSSEPVTTVIHPLSGGGYRELSGALRSQELSTLTLVASGFVTDFDPDGCMVRIDPVDAARSKRDTEREGKRLRLVSAFSAPTVSIALLHGAG